MFKNLILLLATVISCQAFAQNNKFIVEVEPPRPGDNGVNSASGAFFCEMVDSHAFVGAEGEKKAFYFDKFHDKILVYENSDDYANGVNPTILDKLTDMSASYSTTERDGLITSFEISLEAEQYVIRQYAGYLENLQGRVGSCSLEFNEK